jgi:hypothetical protein
MRCDVNTYCRKLYKKHKWNDRYTKGIYIIHSWHLQRKITENVDPDNANVQSLRYYAFNSGIHFLADFTYTFLRCQEGIKVVRGHIKQKILGQSKAKEQYRYDQARPTGLDTSARAILRRSYQYVESVPAIF